MKAQKIEFNIWCEDESSAQELSKIIQDFINEQGAEGRAVTAEKIISAINRWKDNAYVKNRINKYFENGKEKSM